MLGALGMEKALSRLPYLGETILALSNWNLDGTAAWNLPMTMLGFSGNGIRRYHCILPGFTVHCHHLGYQASHDIRPYALGRAHMFAFFV